MAANAPPFAPGDKALASTANTPIYNANLGKSWTVDGAEWRLVKTGAILATPQRFTVVTAVSGGLPTWIVDTTTTANNKLVIGVFKSTQVALALGDFALVQVSGFAEIISAGAIADKAAISTSTTAGKADDATSTVGDTFAYALESAAGADENVAVRLVNLI